MQNDHKVPALVLGSSVVALAYLYELTENGVPVIHLCPKNTGVAWRSKSSREQFVVPLPWVDSDGLLKALMDGPPEWGGACLIPTDDQFVRFVSRHRQELASRFLIPLPEWSQLKRIVNKDLLYELAEAENVPYPRSSSSESPAGISYDVNYPCILKPHRSPRFVSVFGKKVLEINDRAELDEKLAETQKEGFGVMLSEIIPGSAENIFTHQVYIDQRGKVAAEVCCQKLRIHPEDYGSASVIRTIPMNQELRRQGLALLRGINYSGLADIEFKLDPRDQVLKLIEINPRLPTFSRLFRAAGTNFAYQMYRDLIGESVEEPKPYRQGIFCINNQSDIFHLKPHVKRGPKGILEFLKPYFSRHVYQVPFAISDPDPYLYVTRLMWKWIFASGLRRFSTLRVETDVQEIKGKQPG